MWALPYTGSWASGSEGRREEEGWDSPILFSHLCQNHMCITNHNANQFKCWCCPVCPTLSVHVSPPPIVTKHQFLPKQGNVCAHWNWMDSFHSYCCVSWTGCLWLVVESLWKEKNKCILRLLKGRCPQWHIFSTSNPLLVEIRFAKSYVVLGPLIFCHSEALQFSSCLDDISGSI